MVDQLTSWPISRAIPDKEATTIANAVYRDLLLQHGAPEILLSDNGKEFSNDTLAYVCEEHGIKQHFTSPYTPRSNGKTENFNKFLKASIRKLCQEDNAAWDQVLDQILCTYKFCPQTSTGEAPYTLLYFRDPHMLIHKLIQPVETYKGDNTLAKQIEQSRVTLSMAAKMLEKMRENHKRYYKKRKSTHTFKVGDLVLYQKYNKEKLDLKWEPNYRIIKLPHLWTAVIENQSTTFTTGKITPQIIDPKHLRQELIKINKQLPPKITLPGNPRTNIWHYYKFLTVTPLIDDSQLILMIRIPLLDTDSTMTLYKVYNLPIYNPTIGKSLSYQLEGSNLAITKDNNYVSILTEAEFIQCTLVQGHFCSLNTALYHIDYSNWCLVAMFLKENNRINKDCKLSVTNITGPQAIYLDQGLWAISVKKPTQMEIRCPKVTQVKSLKPPITLINLQPACSAFSPGVKLPPYFKQFSKGFHVALKSAHLNIPKYNPTNFRIWHTFNVSNLSPIESERLKKLAPAPTIPIGQLRAQIASFQHININNDKKQSWIIVGSGSGSGILLLVVICGCLYWRCKNHQSLKTRSPAHVTYTDPENSNMMHTREDAIRSDRWSELGLKTVGSRTQ